MNAESVLRPIGGGKFLSGVNRYVFCFVFDSFGRVLVLRRADFMRARPGEWDLPGGGLDDGEEYEIGLRREITEETGLELGKLELVVRRGGEWQDGKHEFSYFRANAVAGEVRLSEEHTEYEWHEPLVAATMVQYKPHLFGLAETSRIAGLKP